MDYLQTSFSPDVEDVDGELKGRNMGSYEHARLRLLVRAWFAQMEKYGVQGATEHRTRSSDSNILIPEVALLPRGPQPRVIEQPPILAVEILSSGDGYAELTIKIRKYLNGKTLRSGDRPGDTAWTDLDRSLRLQEQRNTQC